jgi:hypothetical protein
MRERYVTYMLTLLFFSGTRRTVLINAGLVDSPPAKTGGATIRRGPCNKPVSGTDGYNCSAQRLPHPEEIEMKS